MDFPSHSCRSVAAIQALADVETSGLIPALNLLVQEATGMGVALDGQAASQAYEALIGLDPQVNFDADLEDAFAPSSGLIPLLEGVMGQAVDDFLPPENRQGDVLNAVGGVYTEAASLLQSWREQPEMDVLMGREDCSDDLAPLEPVDLQQYWFYYSYDPTQPDSADSYLGSVIAPEGTYELAPRLPGGGYDPAYGFNPKAQLNEANSDGKYIVYSKMDYDDARLEDQGKVFVLSYTDREDGSETRVTPQRYAQGGQASGFNFLGSELDYLDGNREATRFGQDYYEADIRNPDLEIQAFTPLGYFSPLQRRAIDTAISNWDQLITVDKDESGVLKLAFTRTIQRLDGADWDWVWGEAYLDTAVGERVNRNYTTVDIGGDFHNRVNYNSARLEQLSSHQLIRLTMHEIGHALGLGEAQDDALLGMDSVMDKHGLDPRVTEGMFQRLESLGYQVNRAAANRLQWY